MCGQRHLWYASRAVEQVFLGAINNRLHEETEQVVCNLEDVYEAVAEYHVFVSQ